MGKKEKRLLWSRPGGSRFASPASTAGCGEDPIIPTQTNASEGTTTSTSARLITARSTHLHEVASQICSGLKDKSVLRFIGPKEFVIKNLRRTLGLTWHYPVDPVETDSMTFVDATIICGALRMGPTAYLRYADILEGWAMRRVAGPPLAGSKHRNLTMLSSVITSYSTCPVPLRQNEEEELGGGRERRFTIYGLNRLLARELHRVLDQVYRTHETREELGLLSGVHWGCSDSRWEQNKARRGDDGREEGGMPGPGSGGSLLILPLHSPDKLRLPFPLPLRRQNPPY
ncbi:hypothetical protein MKZ38_001158 [Zalerion maritima]|uniref:Uncharacterized protein n=1 Tax=Zalerion maritima TaxID=339359 RepID=A0AAD5RQJ5_9PEZI|nr:hypothetical protein MKZ38_001158 [Zalerion maritima]